MADSKAKTAWKAEHTTRVVMNLNNRTDADILRKLDEVESKQGYIKELIRKDLRMRSYSAYAKSLKENEGLFEINEDGTMLLCIGSHVEPGEENPYDVPVSVWQLVSADNQLIDIVYRDALL